MQTDNDLLRSAIHALLLPHNHPRHCRGKVFWAYVADVFCVGSSTACALCERFGIDPSVKMK